MKRKLLSFILMCFSLQAFSQKSCFTMENLSGNQSIEYFSYPGAEYQNSTATWSLTGGYGATCDSNCTFDGARTPIAQPCDNDPCGNGTGVYLVPVKVTIFRDDDGSNAAISAAAVTQQIADMNAYHCCQGIPIQFYEISGSPFYEDNTALNNGGNFPSATYNSKNYLDIFVVTATQNGAGCNGFASLPFNSNSESFAVMDNNCFQSVPDPCTDTGIGLVLFHEIGHTLGLFHTHETFQNCDDPAIATDDCSNGDFISDTDEDPDFSGGQIGCTGCQATLEPDCSFDETTPECLAYGQPNTLNNVMSYNNFVGCRQEYTTCQKAKMIDALICARTNYCDPDVSRYFSNPDDAVIEICIGDAIPTITTDLRTCVEWYSADSGGSPLATGASFTPSASEVDVNTPGEYDLYFQDINGYEDTRCKKVTVKVIGNPGDASSTTEQCVANSGTVDMSLTGASTLPDGEITGWWITKETPIATTVTSQATLDTQNPTVLTTDDGSSNMENVVIKNSVVGADGLSINCNNLMPNTTYYATPFVSKDKPFEPATSCSVSQTVTNDLTINTSNGPRQGAWTGSGVSFNPTPSCPASHSGEQSVIVRITLDNYVGSGTLQFRFRNSACNSNLYTTGLAASTGDVFEFTPDEIGVDPTQPGNEICFLLWDAGTTFGDGNIDFTVDIIRNYAESPAITFPTASYSSCLFGEPVSFSCGNCVLPVKFVDFTATPTDNNQVSLKWSTASEVNNDRFEVLHSTNGINWFVIDVLPGEGTTNQLQEYAVVHESPDLLLPNYYQIRQIDFDGEEDYTDIKVVQFEGLQSRPIVYPNPTDGVVYIASAEQVESVKVFNSSGALEKHIENNDVVDFTSLPKGIYLVEVFVNKERYVFKVSKQ